MVNVMDEVDARSKSLIWKNFLRDSDLVEEEEIEEVSRQF
jgi:hypothetical protein